MADALWQVWLLYWGSASFIGSFVGASLALLVHRIIKRRKQWHINKQQV